MDFEPIIKTRRTAQSSAFTIVEVLIAVGVGGIVFVTLYMGLAQGFGSVKRVHHRLRATQILTEKLEVIRLYSWTQINTTGFIPATFTDYYLPASGGSNGTGVAYRGTLTVTNAAIQPAYSNTLRRVVAQVTWVDGGITNQQRMDTFVSQYGIQNYIY